MQKKENLRKKHRSLAKLLLLIGLLLLGIFFGPSIKNLLEYYTQDAAWPSALLLAFVTLLLLSSMLISSTLVAVLAAATWAWAAFVPFMLVYVLAVYLTVWWTKKWSLDLLSPKQLHWIQQFGGEKHFLFVFSLRMNPLFPFGLGNLVLGMRKTPYWAVGLGSLVAALPRNAVLFWICIQAIEGHWWQTALLLGSSMLSFVLLGYLYKKKKEH